MQDSSHHGKVHPKLNILALPPYTAIFFTLITLVILGAAFASLLPYSQLWWPLIVLPLTVLPLRDFLHWPDRESSAHRFRLPTSSELLIQQAVDDLSRKVGIHPPQVLINEDDRTLYAFGTFRRHFISVGANMAGTLTDELKDHDAQVQDTARALLAHEVAHFANGDMWRAALARSMLKSTLWTALISMWAAATFVGILIQIGPEITDSHFWTAAVATTGVPGLSLQWFPEMMQAENPKVFAMLADPSKAGQFWNYAVSYLLNIFIPFLFAVPILYVFFWRKLMRVREFYADIRSASWIGDSRRVSDAMLLNAMLSSARVGPSAKHLKLSHRAFAFLPKTKLLSHHPSKEERKVALQHPMLLFGQSWQIALWTGIAVLLLEIILRSSLTLIYISQPGPYLPLLTATAVFGVWLLPHIYAGESFQQLRKTALKMAVIFILVKLSINFLDALFLGLFTLFGHLDTVGAMLDTYLRSMLGGAGTAVGPIFGGEFGWSQAIEWHIIRPIAYYIGFGIPLLTLTLIAFIWLIQKTLTWYRAGQKIVSAFWGVLLLLMLIEIMWAFPLANILFFPMIYDYTWKTIALLISGLLIVMVAGMAFYTFHHRHARTCPQCQRPIPGDFSLGNRCPHCHHPLHSWLDAPYL